MACLRRARDVPFTATKVGLTFSWPPASRYQFAVRIAENFSKKYSFCSRARTISRSSTNQEPLPANFSPDCSIFRHTVEALVKFFTANGAVTCSMPGRILEDNEALSLQRETKEVRWSPLGIDDVPLRVVDAIRGDQQLKWGVRWSRRWTRATAETHVEHRHAHDIDWTRDLTLVSKESSRAT